MRIALVSDTHLAARAAVCLDNWRVVRTWIERARPDLVVHLGDITVDGASDAVELREALDAFTCLDVPTGPRDRLLAIVRSRALRFVVSGHTHQSRRHVCGGVEHRWAPSTAFCLPDGMQERIGEKEVGLLMLMLDGTDHRFAMARPEGLRRNNILDHAELYPGLAELRAALGSSAVL
jgi:hypothetical protein